MNKVVKDALGNEIEVGDIITYPGRRGSSVWLNYAVVIRIEWITGSYRSMYLTPKLIAIRAEEELTWATVNDKYVKTSRNPPYVRTRKVYIECIHRVIRIPNTMLNPEVNLTHQELLDIQTQSLVGSLTN